MSFVCSPFRPSSAKDCKLKFCILLTTCWATSAQHFVSMRLPQTYSQSIPERSQNCFTASRKSSASCWRFWWANSVQHIVSMDPPTTCGLGIVWEPTGSLQRLAEDFAAKCGSLLVCRRSLRIHPSQAESPGHASSPVKHRFVLPRDDMLVLIF